MKSLTNLADTDFLESPISLAPLDSTEFERMVFYLLDEMGFTDILWRKGGDGNTSTDGGRDIEATYWRFDPVKTVAEKFWFEVKFRANQLSKNTVQSIITNANGNTDLDRLVIVTNSTVSNQCVDWVKNFQQKHSSIKVSIWQGHDIELILRKNPKTLAQFFSNYLNQAGRFKVIESKFLNFFHLPSGIELDELWAAKNELFDAENYNLLFAAVMGELESDGIIQHNWGMECDSEIRIGLASFAIHNLLSFADRIHEHRERDDILVRGVTYLLQCILLKDSVDLAYLVLVETERYAKGAETLPIETKQLIINPIIGSMLRELVVRCSKNCLKVSYGLSEDDANKRYFERLGKSAGSKDNTDDGSFLIISARHSECEIELVDIGDECPLLDHIRFNPARKEDVYESLAFMKNVLTKRLDQYSLHISNSPSLPLN